MICGEIPSRRFADISLPSIGDGEPDVIGQPRPFVLNFLYTDGGPRIIRFITVVSVLQRSPNPSSVQSGKSDARSTGFLRVFSPPPGCSVCFGFGSSIRTICIKIDSASLLGANATHYLANANR